MAKQKTPTVGGLKNFYGKNNKWLSHKKVEKAQYCSTLLYATDVSDVGE
jgi:hypothetical protein